MALLILDYDPNLPSLWESLRNKNKKYPPGNPWVKTAAHEFLDFLSIVPYFHQHVILGGMLVKIILNVGIDVSNRLINASISATTLEITP